MHHAQLKHIRIEAKVDDQELLLTLARRPAGSTVWNLAPTENPEGTVRAGVAGALVGTLRAVADHLLAIIQALETKGAVNLRMHGTYRDMKARTEGR